MASAKGVVSMPGSTQFLSAKMPDPQDVRLPGAGQLLGFLDCFIEEEGNGEPTSNSSKCRKYIKVLEEGGVVRAYPRTLQLPDNAGLENVRAERVFVYKAQAPNPMSPSFPRRSCTKLEAINQAFLFVFTHLRWDWAQAWIGLGRLADGNPEHENCCELAKSAGVNNLLYCQSGKSRCGVLGCRDHPVIKCLVKKREMYAHKRRFSLQHIFNGLEPPRPVDLVGRTNGGDSRLLNMTERVYLIMLSYCDAMSLDNFGLSCRAGHAMVFDATPGIQLTLMKHQRSALRWMLVHEGRLSFGKNNAPTHPGTARGRTGDGPPVLCETNGKQFRAKPFQLVAHVYHRVAEKSFTRVAVADLMSSTIAIKDLVHSRSSGGDTPPENILSSGGMYCDDPGLGKTITTLALILRTKHHTPRLGRGTEVVVDSQDGGKKMYWAPVNRANEMMQEAKSDPEFLRSSPSIRSSPRLQRRASSEMECTQAVYLSSCTLVVVPSTLVKHWSEQIRMHVAAGMLKVKIMSGENRGENENNHARGAGHHGILPRELCQFDVVLTTFSYLSTEWRRHKGESAFMRVHWLRIILDEGHELGRSVTLTNRLQMCCMMRADRRWVMTGTPTPSGTDSEVRHLFPLLKFLQVSPFHQRTGVSAYRRLIQRPFGNYDGDGVRRLNGLLEHVMIRSNKRKIVNFPTLKEHSKILDFENLHAESYSQLVEVITRHMLLADFNDPNHREHLLNSRQGKQAKQTAENIRLNCCVAGRFNLRIFSKDLVETLDILQYGTAEDGTTMAEVWKGDRCLICDCAFSKPNSFGKLQLKRHWNQHASGARHIEAVHIKRGAREKRFPHTKRLEISNALSRGIDCEKCGIFTIQPMVTPCACLLCAWCTASSRKNCPKCQKAYKMQAIDCPERKSQNSNPQWEVPVELIELQPSYQASWGLDFAISRTQSSKINFLLSHLKGYFARFEWNARTGKWVNPKSPNETRKVIVFSQYYQHLLAIEQALERNNIMKAQVYGSNMAAKVNEIQKFRTNPHVSVLLMDVNGAVGLDLYFVSQLFLMDPVIDKSLEEQIIARAWRMGAKTDVNVYRLAMKDSVEHRLLLSTVSDTANIDWLIGMEAQYEKDTINENGTSGTMDRRSMHMHATKSILMNLNRIVLAQPPVSGGPEFIPSPRFAGARAGYIFKDGGRGLGYYLDLPPPSLASSSAGGRTGTGGSSRNISL